MMAALFAPLSAGWLRILRDKGTEWTVLRSGRSPYGSKRTGGGWDFLARIRAVSWSRRCRSPDRGRPKDSNEEAMHGRLPGCARSSGWTISRQRRAWTHCSLTVTQTRCFRWITWKALFKTRSAIWGALILAMNLPSRTWSGAVRA